MTEKRQKLFVEQLSQTAYAFDYQTHALAFQTDKVSELLDSWVEFQGSSGLKPYIKINTSLEPNTFKAGDGGVTRISLTSKDIQWWRQKRGGPTR